MQFTVLACTGSGTNHKTVEYLASITAGRTSRQRGRVDRVRIRATEFAGLYELVSLASKLSEIELDVF